jgi:hypothetical protein
MIKILNAHEVSVLMDQYELRFINTFGASLPYRASSKTVEFYGK